MDLISVAQWMTACLSVTRPNWNGKHMTWEVTEDRCCKDRWSILQHLYLWGSGDLESVVWEQSYPLKILKHRFLFPPLIKVKCCEHDKCYFTAPLIDVAAFELGRGITCNGRVFSSCVLCDWNLAKWEAKVRNTTSKLVSMDPVICH
jgi:hypothetical protein